MAVTSRFRRRLVLALLALALAVFGLDRWLDGREAAIEAAWPPEGRLIEVEGQKVHVLVLPATAPARGGKAADIVLIHGAGGNWRDMTGSIAPALRARFRVFVVDRPGHGWTAPLPGPDHGPFVQAQLLRAAVKAAGGRAPVVVGHSYGGAVALAWAELYPDETPALVLLAPAARPWRGLPQRLLLLLGNEPAAGALAFVAALLAPGPVSRFILARRIFAPEKVPPDYVEKRAVALALRRMTQKAVTLQLADLVRAFPRLEAGLGRVRMPVEIVQGTADRMVRFEDVSPPLAHTLPDARLTAIEGAGHMVHWLHRDAVLAAIDRAASRADLP